MLTHRQEYYRKKLQDPRWKAKSLEIKALDGNACRLCKSTLLLDVHHIEYMSGQDPWDYPDCDLITLCRGCHFEQHTLSLKEKRTILAFKLAGFSEHYIHSLSYTLVNFSVDDYPKFPRFLQNVMNNPELMDSVMDVYNAWYIVEEQKRLLDPNEAEYTKIFGV